LKTCHGIFIRGKADIDNMARKPDRDESNSNKRTSLQP
jgi:preprotein translocase subunit Sss1